MKNLLIIPFFCLISASNVWAYPTVMHQTPLPAEQIHLQLSENVVTTGETLWFQGTLFGDRPLSKVLYVEVLNEQQAVLQGIYPIKNGIARGQFVLPDTLSDGWYQVRAYTQWMRNLGETSFALQPLMVINPSESRPLLSQEASGEQATSRANTNPEAMPVPIELNKTNYRPREPLTARIRLNNIADSARVSVSVRKVNPLTRFLSSQPTVFDSYGVHSDEPLRYPVEDETLLVSGRVEGMSPETIDRVVTLSVPGQNPYFDYDFVDQDGYFRIPVKESVVGERPVVIQVNDATLDPTWMVDEKFAPSNASASLSLPGIPIAALRETQQTYTQRAQIRLQYDLPHPIDSVANPTTTPVPFYGAPNYTIRPGDYTALPNMNELVRELLIGVQMRKSKDGYWLRMVDLDARVYLQGDPTTLIDGVLVRNVPYIAGMDPDSIDRIESVNRRTYYGEYRLNGTLAIYSKTGDAYVNALSSSTWHQPVALYSFYQPYTAPDLLAEYEPDFRTLLHWQPAVVLTNKPYELSVRNADELGEFEIVVEGIDRDGQPLYGRQTYTVTFAQ